MLTEIPTLERLCQEVLANEAAKYGSKKINELCKRIPSHLLESILQSLLDRNQVTDVALNMFLVPSRTNLVMNGFCKIKNSTFKQIGYSCPNLLSLNLSDCVQLSNTVVRAVLQGCPVLEDLRLDRCHRVTDAAFDVNQSPFLPLMGLMSLRIISLQGCPQVTGSIVATLNKSCGRLKYLNFSQCNQLESGAIQQLFEHGQLCHLNLSFVEEVTDDAFLTLPSFTPPPGRTLSPKWSRRKTLIMTDDTAVTPSAGSDRSPKANKMKQNNRCSSLRMLQLAKSRVTDKSMLRMAFFADLLEIHLQWCSGITDTGIAALVTGCPRLEIIDLKSCSITDAAIGLIAKGSKELRSLDVSWCSNLTDSGIQRLSSRDPPPLNYERMASSLLAVRQTITELAVTLTPQQSAALALDDAPSSSSAPHLPSPSVHLHSEVTHSSEGPAEVSSLGTARAADVASSSRMIINGTNLHQNRINGDRSWYYGAGGVDDYESDDKTFPRKLENLVIVWCLQLTDASLVTLASLPKLRSVEATGCTSLSEAAVQTLRKQGVKVVN